MRIHDLSICSINVAPGVRLHIIPTDKFKTNLLSVSFVAPLDENTVSENALIPNILMRGSDKYPDMAEINKRLDYLYASEISTVNYRRGAFQIFGLAAYMLDDGFAPDGEDITSGVTEMLAELLFNPISSKNAFDPDYTESEKINLVDSINAEINNKAVYADRRCLAEMCKDEPFSIFETGTVESVEACTPESVFAQYKYALAHYPLEIFFVGSCDADRLTTLVKRLFTIPEREPITLEMPALKLAAEQVRYVSEDMPVAQGKLVLGFRTGGSHEDRFAFAMFNAIFGGSVTSKLFMNVREKMSLCYYCVSVPETGAGIMLVRSGIESDKYEVAKDAILEQLEAVKRGDFTDEELESSLLYLINAYKETEDSAARLRSYYLTRLLQGHDSSPDEEIECLKAVTREQIIAAAERVTLDTVFFLNGVKAEGDESDE